MTNHNENNINSDTTNNTNNNTDNNNTNNEQSRLVPSSSPIPDNQILYYFAYGSNMCSSILRAKNVHIEPTIESTAACLHDHELLFNLAVDSIVEPSFANIRYQKGSVVHGVLHAFSHDNMLRMDKLESDGTAYLREKVKAVRYNGEEVECYAYFCYDDNKMGIKLIDTPPSKRYLNVLIHGAESFNLKPEYINWLKSHPFTDYPKLILSEERKLQIERRRWTMEEISHFAHPLSEAARSRWTEICEELSISSVNSPTAVNRSIQESKEASETSERQSSTTNKRIGIVALKGIVFEISSNKQVPDAYFQILCGKETAFLVANRVAADLETSSLVTSVEGLTTEQKVYIDATVMEFLRYPIVGHTEEREKFNW